MKPNKFMALGACAVAVCAALGNAWAQDAAAANQPTDDKAERIVVTGKRAKRVSKGATGLPLEVKDTPQSIGTIDERVLANYGLADVNDALRLGTGLNVDQYETNRAVFNSRGFEIQMTQIDGLGVANDWGTVVGQQDAYLFERIELIRGANGLLTGVGNASGTINYVRKRPKNADGGEVGVAFGSWNKRRFTLDYNKVLTTDGDWAARVVLTHDDKDSYLRALHDQRTSLYAVVDGQIGRDGVLTLGLTHQDAKQRSPMWGSLTLNYADGSRADFDVSSSTSQDWTRWNTRTSNAFAEYTHRLGNEWEAKVTLTQRRSDEATKLFYAYPSPGTGLNPDNTGLVGWPYRSIGDSSSTVLDANASGAFQAFGRSHSAIVGVNQSRQKHDADNHPVEPSLIGAPLPAFPYAGDVVAEPIWGARSDASAGKQRLTRLYAATRLAVTPALKAILGVNAIRLHREGQSRFGSQSTVTDPDTSKVSPYVGFTYDLTPDVLAYASYSDIFLSQDQTDINGANLAPMRGVNVEAGVKAEWLNRNLLTTFAVFGAQQDGLATFAGADATTGQFFYEPKDVKSRGVEFEATGRLTARANLAAGITHLKLTGPDGNDIYEWVPRTTIKLRLDTGFDAVPALRVGAAVRWQSKTVGTAATQNAHAVADAFASHELTSAATLRLNVNNLFDKKYVGGLAYGAIYGAPRNVGVSLAYAL
jgi:outer-membrane receptor for ferric coprogen and ferric-rhodotorulic acid